VPSYSYYSNTAQYLLTDDGMHVFELLNQARSHIDSWIEYNNRVVSFLGKEINQ